MKLKWTVAITMGVSFTLFTLILIAGLFVPKSVLVSLSRDKQAAKEALQNTTDLSSTSGGTQQQSADTATSSDPNSTTSSNGNQSSTPSTSTSTSGSASPSTGSTGGSTGSTGGTTGSAAPAPVAPSLTFSGSPTTITSGSSVVLSWSINNTATAPVTCTGAGGTFAGSKATSGSQSVSPTSTTSYTLTCTNSAGSSGTKTVSITVNAPAASCGQSGGSCTAAQVATHNSSANCWVIYSGSYYVLSGANLPSGKSAYPSQHNGGSGAFTSSTCGHDITAYMNGSTNAGTSVSRHNHSGSAYSTLNSYKVGPVN